MAVRLVNKSKADCDINLFSGRVVRIRPLSYITLDEKFTKASVEYYNQLRDLGLYLEKDPEPVVEKKADIEINADADKEKQEEVVVVETPAAKPEVVKTEEPEKADEVQTSAPSALAEGVTEKELMKHTHGQLLTMASAYGLSGLEALSKKEICVKILEAAGAGE